MEDDSHSPNNVSDSSQPESTLEQSDTSPKETTSGRTFLTSVVADGQRVRPGQTNQFATNLKKRVEEMKEGQPSLSFNLGRASGAVEKLRVRSSRVVSALSPATVAIAQLFYRRDGSVQMTLPAVYALALLGASSGFYLFLYFITVGYACGIALPLAVALLLYNTRSGLRIPVLTNVHSGLAVVWGVRSAFYFLYREYVNWPQLHEKVVEVDKMAHTSSKVFCWIVYSFLYLTMVLPCLSRLDSALKGDVTWGTFGMFAVGLQTTGLLLEAVSDYQKSRFKGQPGNRSEWCHVGLWKFSTHPNYLGEQLFWLGTYLGGAACLHSPVRWIMATIGLLFISVVLSGARSSLGSKHLRKYGNNVEFLEFRRTHSMFGPMFWKQANDRLSL